LQELAEPEQPQLPAIVMGVLSRYEPEKMCREFVKGRDCLQDDVSGEEREK
jgi:hypothetical protein